MLRIRLAGLISVLLFSPIPAFAQGQTTDTETVHLLLVVNAASGIVEDETLRLNGIPSVVFFSDRPARIVGHLTVAQFVDNWNAGSDSFADDPPNASLSVLEAGADIDDLVMEVESVALIEDGLQFEFRVLGGSAPRGGFGPSALFFDLYNNMNPCGPSCSEP